MLYRCLIARNQNLTESEDDEVTRAYLHRYNNAIDHRLTHTTSVLLAEWSAECVLARIIVAATPKYVAP